MRRSGSSPCSRAHREPASRWSRRPGVEVRIAELERVGRIEEDRTRSPPADVLPLAEHAGPEHPLPVAAGNAHAGAGGLGARRTTPRTAAPRRRSARGRCRATEMDAVAGVSHARTTTGRVCLGKMRPAPPRSPTCAAARHSSDRPASECTPARAGAVELRVLVVLRLDAPPAADPHAEAPDPPAGRSSRRRSRDRRACARGTRPDSPATCAGRACPLLLTGQSAWRATRGVGSDGAPEVCEVPVAVVDRLDLRPRAAAREAPRASPRTVRRSSARCRSAPDHIGDAPFTSETTGTEHEEIRSRSTFLRDAPLMPLTIAKPRTLRDRIARACVRVRT